MESLAGSTAIISGGLGDIGAAIGLELARRGASIALGDVLDEADAEPALAAIRELGAAARYDRVDVTDAAAVRRWVEAVETSLGLADMIIPNAAIVIRGGVRNTTPEEWDREIRVNLNGAFHLAQAGALRLLRHERPGRIVFTGSWAAHAPHPSIPAYCASKAGIRMLCRCMAVELAPAGILVNEVAPGYVDAGLTGRMFKAHPDRREASLARVPVGELISAEEVAQQVAHLCAPSNRQMTGTVILVDGGLSLVNPSSLP